MFNRISDVLPRLRIYLQLFPDHQRLAHVISLVYWDILKFCSEAKKVFRRPKITLSKLTWKPFERQFGEIIESFREHEKTVDKEVTTSHMIEAANSRELVKADRQALAENAIINAEIKVFSDLSTIDNAGYHETLQDLKFPHTANWILHFPEYTNWLNSTTGRGLCIYGIPGSGKSVLSSSVIDDLRTRSQDRVMYHYCNYADPTTLNPAQIYRTLIKQCFMLGLLSQANKDRIMQACATQHSRISEEILITVLLEATTSQDSCFLILDGLDECEKSTQKIMLGFVKRLMTGSKVLKTLLTCREEAAILESMDHMAKIHVCEESNALDIKEYVSAAVWRHISSGELLISNRQLKEEVISTLAAKANGM